MQRDAVRNASLLAVFACAALVASGLMTTKTALPQSPSPSSVTCADYEGSSSDFPPLPTSLDATCARIPLDMVGTPGQSSADAYGWLTFVALNWPVDPMTCAANPALNVTTARPNPTWLSYLSDDAVFVASGRPATWCNAPATSSNALGAMFASPAAAMAARRSFTLAHLPPRVSALAATHPEVTLFLHHSAKSQGLVSTLTTERRLSLTPRMNALLGDPHLHGILDATDQPVTDQNGRFVRYTVALNLDEYGYVVRNALWTKAGQQRTGALSFPASGGAGKSGPTGAMEFKAAWKVLGRNDDPSHFFWQWAIVYNDVDNAPSPGANPVKVGLVGLHITHKTARQPHWLWATFEQTDNQRSFNNPTCAPAQCPPNVETAPTPYVELNANGTPRNKPVQVVPVSPSTAGSLNASFQRMLGNSPWAHYKLISTQWEGNFPPGPKPAKLGNSVLETFVAQTNPYSCEACHTFGHDAPGGFTSDFSFLIGAKQ